jgi:serine/threonine protein kinase
MKIFHQNDDDDSSSSGGSNGSVYSDQTEYVHVNDCTLDLGTLREVSCLAMFSPAISHLGIEGEKEDEKGGEKNETGGEKGGEKDETGGEKGGEKGTENDGEKKGTENDGEKKGTENDGEKKGTENDGEKKGTENDGEKDSNWFVNPNHPHIITMLDITYNKYDELCMIMPKMHIDLEDAIKNDILTIKMKINIAYKLLSALDFLHENDVIHRDIKTDNVLLDENMRPYLADFSLAKIFGKTDVEYGHTHTGEMGTPVFRPPEVVNGLKYDRSADVYSIGVVFVEMFNGILKMDKDKQSQEYIKSTLSQLSDKPLPHLLKRLLDPDNTTRISAKDALKLPIFSKLRLIPVKRVVNKKVNTVKVKNLSKKEKKQRKTVKDDIHRKWVLLEYKNTITKDAARYYHKLMDGRVDYLHCLVLAGKLYEIKLLSFSSVVECIPDFDIISYAQSEKQILRACNFCLFI